MGVHHGDIAENESECSISHLQFQNFPGDDTPDPRCGRGDPLTHQHGAGLRRRCCDPHVTPVLGVYILRASSVSETFRRPCTPTQNAHVGRADRLNSHRHTRHDKTVAPACRPPPRRRSGRQLGAAARPPTRSDVVGLRHAKCKHVVQCI